MLNVKLIDIKLNQVYNMVEIMPFVRLVIVLVFLSRASATPLNPTIQNIASPVARSDTGIFSKTD